MKHSNFMFSKDYLNFPLCYHDQQSTGHSELVSPRLRSVFCIPILPSYFLQGDSYKLFHVQTKKLDQEKFPTITDSRLKLLQ